MSLIEIRMPAEEKEGTEAAIAAWLKEPGQIVAEHEPLLEISTDKVTLEIPAPASGVLQIQLKSKGDFVNPGDLLGAIVTSDTSTSSTGAIPYNSTEQDPAFPEPAGRQGWNTAAKGVETAESAREARTTFSPVVRRLLAELGLDPQAVAKTSRGGRLTPEDIRAHLSSPQSVPTKGSAATVSVAEASIGRAIPHTPMRKSIAAHMARSVQTAPHVTAVFEADLHNVLADREVRRQTADGDAVPSITAYLIHAALTAVALVPEVNSRWHDTHLEVFDHVHFGVGTALDAGGLVVPVIRDAHTMDLLTLSRKIREMTAKARTGKLTQRDMDAGTFTLSNHGISGSLLAAPIILPHGQAAILGAGKVQKRVIVCETGGRELFRVRPMMYVTLTVDHRVLNAQQTNAFLTAFVTALEQDR